LFERDAAVRLLEAGRGANEMPSLKLQIFHAYSDLPRTGRARHNKRLLGNLREATG
jgi:hypothetical protein